MVEIKSQENNTVKLPNNIRQVGTPGEKIKIYIEDYVMTYLNQITGEKPAEQKMALLLGEKVQKENTDIYFISAAMAVVPVEWKEDQFKLSSDEWAALYDRIDQYFKNKHILGWFLSRPGQAASADGQIEKYIQIISEIKAIFFIHQIHWTGKMPFIFMRMAICSGSMGTIFIMTGTRICRTI